MKREALLLTDALGVGERQDDTATFVGESNTVKGDSWLWSEGESVDTDTTIG